MKDVVKFDKAIGTDGLKAAGGVGIDGTDFVGHTEIRFPIVKAIDPLMKVVDNLVDKVEKLIPGDQTALAAKLKLEARDEIAKLIAAQA